MTLSPMFSSIGTRVDSAIGSPKWISFSATACGGVQLSRWKLPASGRSAVSRAKVSMSRTAPSGDVACR